MDILLDMRKKSQRRLNIKKRKYIKRTRKYKILKGGLGSNDYENIGINDTFIFQNECNQQRGCGDHSSREAKINEFKKYVFGSEEHASLWEQILLLCREKGIPFYILTSGSKVGIIRTLQLLELSEYVTEVLCNSKILDINPNNEKDKTRNDFKEMDKYQIIQKVIDLNCNRDGYKGLFFDNEPANERNQELCSNVEFMLANGKKIDRWSVKNRILSFVSGLTSMSGPRNPFAELTKQLYKESRINLVETSLLKSILDTIHSGTINVFISDFDGTMSPWCGALPFHFQEFTEKFMSHFNVIATT